MKKKLSYKEKNVGIYEDRGDYELDDKVAGNKLMLVYWTQQTNSPK